MNWSPSRYQVFLRLSQEIEDRIEEIVRVGKQYVHISSGTPKFQRDEIELVWTEYCRGCSVGSYSYTLPADLLWQSHADVHAFFAKKKADIDDKKRRTEEARKTQEAARERVEFERLRVKFES